MVSRHLLCVAAACVSTLWLGCGDDSGAGSGGSGGASTGSPTTAGPGSGSGGCCGEGAASSSGEGATGQGGGGGESASGGGPSTGSTGTSSGHSSSSAGGGEPCAGEATHTGEGTYYDADGTGNCSFDASPDFVAALNDPDYDDAAWCGACAAVDGPNGSIVVRIVDRCPECASGDLDLSPNAFEAIAPLEAGRVDISWRWTACEVAGPIAYHFKEGSNPYWSAIQVRNHRFAVASLEAIDPASGAYVSLVRQDYNFFLWESGLGEGPYTLRATDVNGEVLVDENVVFVEAGTADGAAQFPACQ